MITININIADGSSVVTKENDSHQIEHHLPSPLDQVTEGNSDQEDKSPSPMSTSFFNKSEEFLNDVPQPEGTHMNSNLTVDYAPSPDQDFINGQLETEISIPNPMDLELLEKAAKPKKTPVRRATKKKSSDK